jgi:hypothetical protein
VIDNNRTTQQEKTIPVALLNVTEGGDVSADVISGGKSEKGDASSGSRIWMDLKLFAN